MIRVLAPLAAVYNFDQVSLLTRTRWPAVLGVNIVRENNADHAAAYFNDNAGPTPAAVTAWRTEVAAAPTTALADNRADIVGKLQTALTANQTYLGVASPTVAQNTAQIQRLTRECTGLIRLALEALDTTAGT